MFVFINELSLLLLQVNPAPFHSPDCELRGGVRDAFCVSYSQSREGAVTHSLDAQQGLLNERTKEILVVLYIGGCWSIIIIVVCLI